MSAVLQYLPRGSTLSDEAYDRRHRLLQAVLLIHLPLLFAFGLWRGFGPGEVAEALAAPAACLVLGHLMRSRRPASLFVTLGLVYCSAALVGFSGGAIEAHFHFFIMIGFIALYQDWVPFLVNVLFTVLSHGIGSSFGPGLMFNHPAAQSDPWLWSLIHGVAVLAACVGVVLFWKTSEEEQQRSMDLARRLSEAELGRRRFTSDLLVNLARRNQNLLYRQLDLINNLEEKERDPDALSDLFQLDHLATRIRRNAENLLVLSGEDTPRSWSAPVPLVDVVRAAIAEIEDLDRADLAVDEDLAVSGRVVADLTHLLAELLENAVHFSPPGVSVMVRSRPNLQDPGAQVLTIEDWGVGMGPDEVAEANGLLAAPQDVDLSVSQRLGLHVVARLAARNGTSVTLTPTPGGGVTAAVMLPPSLFTQLEAEPVPDAVLSAPAARVGAAMRVGAAVREPAAVRVGAAVRDPAAVRPAYGRELSEAWGDSSAPAAPPLPPALPTVAALPDAGALAGRAGDAGALPRRSPGRAARDLDRPFGAPRRDARGTGEEDSGQDGWAAWWTPRTPTPTPATSPTGPAGPTRTAPAPAPGPTSVHTGPAAVRTGPAAPAPAAEPTARHSGPATVHTGPLAQIGQAREGGPTAGAGGPATARTAPAGVHTGQTPGPAAVHNGPPAPRSGQADPDAAPAGPAAVHTGQTPGPAAAPDDPAIIHNGPSARDETGGPGTAYRSAADRPASGPTGRLVAEEGGTPLRAVPALPDQEPQPTLSRRVPQANLAAGLRRDSQDRTEPAPATAVSHPAAARDALSRFQTSQRQAREAVRRGEIPPEDQP